MKIEQYLSQMTTEQIEALVADQELRALRDYRNRLLAETDWWALSDQTMTPERAAYRQALRDITNTHQRLLGAQFPAKPE